MFVSKISGLEYNFSLKHEGLKSKLQSGLLSSFCVKAEVLDIPKAEASRLAAFSSNGDRRWAITDDDDGHFNVSAPACVFRANRTCHATSFRYRHILS